MPAVELRWKPSVKLEYNMREEVAEVHNVIFCIQESLEIQLSADVLSASRRKIHPLRLGSIVLHWQWRLVKYIITNKELIMRAMNL